MKHSVQQGMIYLSTSTVIFMISGYLINILLGRYFGPQLYGQYGIIIALMSTLNLFQTSGLPQALSKFIAEEEGDTVAILRSGFILQTLFTFFLTLTYLLFAKPLAWLLHDLTLVPYIQLSALVLPFYSVFALYTGYFNGRRNFKGQAMINIIYSTSKLAGVLLLAYFFKLTGAIAGFIIAPLLIVFYGLPLPRKGFSKFSYKKILLLSFPLMGFVILNNFQQVIDLYFVKSLTHSDTLAGFYTATQNITKLPFVGFCTFIGVVFPIISSNVSQNLHQESRDIIHHILRVVIILLIPATLLISATSGSIITILYSQKYLPAAPSLSILIIGFSFLTIFTILANILNGAGKAYRSVWISGLGVLITVLMCLFLVPRWGILGAALSNTVGSFSSMVFAAYFVYKKFQALIHPLKIIKILFGSLVIYFLATLVHVPLLYLPFWYLTLFLVYFCILFLLKEVSLNEVKYLSIFIKPYENH